MPFAAVNDVELCYEVTGDPQGPAVLLIAGLGVQLIDWPDHFVDPLVESGHYVIRFDNRDIGLSTTFEGGQQDPHAVLECVLDGKDPGVAYTIADMAGDAIGLLDALDIESAHLVGVSMGGMIAQTAAIMFPEQVASLTSLMSSTGSGDVGQPTADAMAAILSVAPGSERDDVIAHKLSSAKIWASPGHFDADVLQQTFSDAWNRVDGPQGDNTSRHFCAIVATPARDEALRSVTKPALVIHGTADRLIAPSGGERTAACLADARLMVIEGMGHDLQPAFSSEITRAIADLVADATTA